jgi:hypothetical protein
VRFIRAADLCNRRPPHPHLDARQSNLHTSLHRRRVASRRLVPLACGCADPWICRCTDPPLSERMVDAGVGAAAHLLAADLPPMFDPPTLRAMWRQGHQQVVQRCRDTYGLAS